jgi:hypothetical protein
MRNALTWGLVLGVALLALAYAFAKVVLDSSRTVRETAVAEVRAKAEEINVRPAVLPLVTANSLSHPIADKPVVTVDCEKQAAQWVALQDRVLGPDHYVDFEEEMSRVRAFWEVGYDPDELSEEEWTVVSDLAASRAEEIDAIKALLANYDPACIFLQQQSDRYYFANYEVFATLLSLDLALAVRENDYDAAMEDLTLLVPLGYRGEGRRFPHTIGSAHLTLLYDALHSGQVQPETWERFLARLREFRRRNVMIYHLLHYSDVGPSNPYGRFRKSNFIVREIARLALEPSHNADVARWAPIMQESAGLTSKPYYAARTELKNLIAAHDQELAGQGINQPDSPARKHMLMLVDSRFLENAIGQIQIDLMSLAIALARFHEDHGTYPLTLDGTADYLDGTVQLNPLNGEPYHYEVIGEAYRLGSGESEAMWFRELNAPGLWLGPNGCTFREQLPFDFQRRVRQDASVPQGS